MTTHHTNVTDFSLGWGEKKIPDGESLQTAKSNYDRSWKSFSLTRYTQSKTRQQPTSVRAASSPAALDYYVVILK